MPSKAAGISGNWALYWRTLECREANGAEGFAQHREHPLDVDRYFRKRRQCVAVLVTAELRQVQLAADHRDIADDIAQREVDRKRMRHAALQQGLQPRQGAHQRAQLNGGLRDMLLAPLQPRRLQALAKSQRLFPQLHGNAAGAAMQQAVAGERDARRFVAFGHVSLIAESDAGERQADVFAGGRMQRARRQLQAQRGPEPRHGDLVISGVLVGHRLALGGTITQ